MKIDHIFIGSVTPNKDSKILMDFGLVEGPPNNHPGQGTANRRFFFQNMYLEFLYIDNDKLAQSINTQPSKLYERITKTSADTNISPFGFGISPSDNGLKITDYTTWEYKPLFIPPPFKMDVYGNSLTEPMYYYMDFLSDSGKINQKIFNHSNGIQTISKVELHTPHASLNTKFKQNFHDHDVINYVQSDTHFLKITFDNGTKNQSYDFRPALPLIFNW